MYSRRIDPFVSSETSLRLEPEFSAFAFEDPPANGISLSTFIEIIAMTKPPDRSLASAMIHGRVQDDREKLIEEIISTKGTDPLDSTFASSSPTTFTANTRGSVISDPHSRLAFVVSKKDIRKRRRARPGIP